MITNSRALWLAVPFALCFGPQVGYTDPVGALTTFTSGTPARASEVNGNFNTVKAAVDNNNSRITTLEAVNAAARIAALETQNAALAAQVTASSGLVVKANGVPIGTLLQWSPSASVLLSSTYYLFIVNAVDSKGRPEKAGEIFQTQFVYPTADCSGSPYTSSGQAPVLGDATSLQGAVFATEFNKQLYYVPRGATTAATNPTFQSRLTGAGCEPFTYVPTANDKYFMPLPNVPSITGVSTASFATPITIGRAQ